MYQNKKYLTIPVIKEGNKHLLYQNNLVNKVLKL